ncbi:MAG TPA: hypothetical protein VME20_13280 [Acidimicrobiales bacterium]|nr:hypothetical protein [Acidimicrobiales bacterium]
MPTAERLVLGAKVTCASTGAGRSSTTSYTLHAIVVDPASLRVTHLVAEPEHRIGLGRLVPVALVAEVGEGVQLTCREDDLEQLPQAERKEILPGVPTGFVPFRGPMLGGPALPTVEVRATAPAGEAETYPGETVYASDGPIGTVAGFEVGPTDFAIVQVLVSEERLFFGHKLIAVPVSAVLSFQPGVRLKLATAEIPR